MSRVGWAAAVGLLGVGAVLLVGSHTRRLPDGEGLQIHLPGLTQLAQLGQTPGPCPSSIYEPGAEYRFERCIGSEPVHWDRCSQVTYSLDDAAAPAGYRSDVARAITLLGDASGLRFVEVDSDGEISITWDSSLYDPKPGTSGEAGVTDYSTQNSLSGPRADSATIRMSAHLVAGSSTRVSEEPVLLHELGHAVGLGHFSGPEVMNPEDRGYSSYQKGDLAGLAVLYQPWTCTR